MLLRELQAGVSVARPGGRRIREGGEHPVFVFVTELPAHGVRETRQVAVFVVVQADFPAIAVFDELDPSAFGGFGETQKRNESFHRRVAGDVRLGVLSCRFMPATTSRLGFSGA